jgi:hypothetical protein
MYLLNSGIQEDAQWYCYLSLMLMKIFGPKRVAMTAEWRALHSEQLNNIDSQFNTVVYDDAGNLLG